MLSSLLFLWTIISCLGIPISNEYKGERDGQKRKHGKGWERVSLSNNMYQVYNGDFFKDKRHGYGALINYKDNHKISVIIGMFNNGKISGYAVVRKYGDNWINEYTGMLGETSYGLELNGQGTMRSFNNGIIEKEYRGELVNTKMEGQGQLKDYVSGILRRLYYGEFKDGHANGNGTWIEYANNGTTIKSRYIGEVKDWDKCGKGILIEYCDDNTDLF